LQSFDRDTYFLTFVTAEWMDLIIVSFELPPGTDEALLFKRQQAPELPKLNFA
jgi:hypothetical protein